jgi:hypothetical protein
VRLGSAIAIALVVLLVVLAVTFAIDYFAEPTIGPRVGLIIAAVVALVAGWGAWAAPLVGQRETAMDLAVWVEKQHGIDSDLVAALQFEDSPDQAGSPQLRKAVIDYVSESAGTWNVFAGHTSAPFWKRFGVLVLFALLVGIPAAIFWPLTETFFNRMLLSEVHYPTSTQITRIAVASEAFDWNGGPYTGGALPVARTAYGAPVRFTVDANGTLPDLGIVSLVTPEGRNVDVEVRPIEGQPRRYEGELPRLLSNVQYTIAIGDAWTDPSPLSLIALPALTLRVAVAAPEYAEGAVEPAALAAGARNVQVLEGSSVGFDLVSNKPLQKAELVLGEARLPLVKLGEASSSESGEAAERWAIGLKDQPETQSDLWRESGLVDVDTRMAYRIEVEDADGLGPETPVEGMIELRTDRPPQVAASVNYQLPVILPTGRLLLAWTARDDLGLDHVELVREITRADGTTDRTTETIPAELAEGGRMARSERKISLESLGLSIGDELRLIVRAYDRRPREGMMDAEVIGESEAIVLRIAPLDQVAAAIREYDEKALDRSEQILLRESEIGGGL